jgi:hypothetical protein
LFWRISSGLKTVTSLPLQRLGHRLFSRISASDLLRTPKCRGVQPSDAEPIQRADAAGRHSVREPRRNGLRPSGDSQRSRYNLPLGAGQDAQRSPEAARHGRRPAQKMAQQQEHTKEFRVMQISSWVRKSPSRSFLGRAIRAQPYLVLWSRTQEKKDSCSDLPVEKMQKHGNGCLRHAPRFFSFCDDVSRKRNARKSTWSGTIPATNGLVLRIAWSKLFLHSM